MTRKKMGSQFYSFGILNWVESKENTNWQNLMHTHY